jgi:hypothetical protein
MIGTQEEYKSFKELFDFIYKGDTQATQLSFALLEYIHLWDDLYDQDTLIEPDHASKVMLHGLTVIAGSPLWGPDMQAHMLNVFYRWTSANEFERAHADDNELSKAWMLRAGVYDLFIVIAGRIHGVDWGASVAPVVHRMYGETREEFLEEMKQCQHQQ